MGGLAIYQLRCESCLTAFHVCRPDYRGQRYCDEDCREVEQAARHRLSSARHQRSDLGRQDHACHQAESVKRKRAKRQALTVEGRQKVALGAEWRPSEGPISLLESDLEANGRTDA